MIFSSLVARGEERPAGRGEESALLMVKKSALTVAWVKNARLPASMEY